MRMHMGYVGKLGILIYLLSKGRIITKVMTTCCDIQDSVVIIWGDLRYLILHDLLVYIKTIFNIFTS